MLQSGVYIATRGYVALSLETTEEDVDFFVKAVEDFISQYHDLLV